MRSQQVGASNQRTASPPPDDRHLPLMTHPFDACQAPDEDRASAVSAVTSVAGDQLGFAVLDRTIGPGARTTELGNLFHTRQHCRTCDRVGEGDLHLLHHRRRLHEGNSQGSRPVTSRSDRGVVRSRPAAKGTRRVRERRRSTTFLTRGFHRPCRNDYAASIVIQEGSGELERENDAKASCSPRGRPGGR